MVGDTADSVGSAGRRGARTGALVVQAGLTGGAVLVRVTTVDAHVVQTDVAQETVMVYTTRHCNKHVAWK